MIDYEDLVIQDFDLDQYLNEGSPLDEGHHWDEEDYPYMEEEED